MYRFSATQIVELVNSIIISCSLKSEPIHEIHQRKNIFEELEKKDSRLYELLDHFINTWESYEFLKKDRDFMMKGRDLWNMQTDLFKSELSKSWQTLKNHLEENKIEFTISNLEDSK